MLIHIIYIYAIINVFIAGYQVGEDKFSWKYNPEDRLAAVLTFIIFVLFGLIIHLWGAASVFRKKAWSWLNEMFQVRFWWEFYFTENYHNLPIDRLRQLNKKGKLRFNKDTIPHKGYRKCVRAINKRNDFIYLEDEVNTNF